MKRKQKLTRKLKRTVDRVSRNRKPGYTTVDELIQRYVPGLVIGVDPSLNGTGLAVLRDGKVAEYHGWTTKKTNQKRNSGSLSWMKLPAGADDRLRLWRIRTVAHWIHELVVSLQIKYRRDSYVALEGYATNSRSNRATDTHELCGLIKMLLWQEGIPMRMYPPTTVKMAVTGSGSADKGDMKIAAYKKFGLEVTKLGEAGENIADAVMLAGLLSAELAVRSGRITMKDLDPNARKALLRITKSEPEAIISRPFLHSEGFDEPEVIDHTE